MTKEQLRDKIEEMRRELDGRITGRGDLADCQRISEQLDELIARYMEL